MLSSLVKINAPVYGLGQSFFHLYPLALFVQKASKFKSIITLNDLTSNSKPINAKESLEVFSLINHVNHSYCLEADGIDANEAIEELTDFLANTDEILSLSLDNDDSLMNFNDVTEIFDAVGKKWTILIITELLTKSKVRYNEFHKKYKKISPGILSSRLKELSKYEIVSRVQVNSIPPEVYYSLTDKGFELVRILEYMKKWKKKWGFIRAV